MQNITYGTVTGRFVIGVNDGPDDGNEPDIIPAQGTITFTPQTPYTTYAVDDPYTLVRAPIRAVLDSEGYLSTPTDSGPPTRGVKLFSTDTGSVTNWTYNVKYVFTPTHGTTPQIPDHSIHVPGDTTQDLTQLVRVPSSPGIGIPQIEATALRAEKAALESATSSQESALSAQEAQTSLESMVVANDTSMTAVANDPTSSFSAAIDEVVGSKVTSGFDIGTVSKLDPSAEPTASLVDGLLNLGLPQGLPGGWDVTTINSGGDLNTYRTAGTYQVPSATDVLNLPGWEAGTLQVNSRITGGNYESCDQIFTPYSGVLSARVVYRRAYVSQAWTPWRAYTSTRTDNTAGRAIYQWDETTNREQLIYGDTGSRSLNGELINGWEFGTGGGIVTIRRTGSIVTMSIRNLKSANATAGYFINALTMSGFSPAVAGRVLPILDIVAVGDPILKRIIVRKSERDFSLPWEGSYTVGDQYRAASVQWDTDDPWPTTLPGTAFGTIPNF